MLLLFYTIVMCSRRPSSSGVGFPRLPAEYILELFLHDVVFPSSSFEACALIESTGNVKLLINLYRHEKNQILVELHRVDGDVIEYHSLSRAIFHAARKNQASQSQTLATEDDREKISVPLTLKHPPRPTVLSNRIKSTLQNEAAVNKTMENIQNLITKDRTDAVRLGMESLSILTGESSSRKQVQLAASKAVLCNDSSWPDIQGMLFGTVMDSCSKHIQSEEKEDSCSDVDDSEFDTQLRLALTIIGNSANVLWKEMDNSDSFVDLDKFKELLFILYDYVKEHTFSSSEESLSTSLHIQTVYQALRCMFYLISLSEELKNEAIDAGVQGVVGDCIGGGCTKHKLLSDISQEIVAILGQKS